ncbi:MAG TPA: hypothetical protein VFD69_10240 [Vicinamibacterales bacterium]|nr:hypothetical protein [Vicinamibacterales bacterium]
MIVHINHIAPSKKKAAGQRSAQSELAGLVTGSMMSMVEEGILDPKLAPSLRVHLDWIQYKTNFRDPVVVRRTADSWGKLLPLAEIAVDLRQATGDRLPEELAKAVKSLADAPDANPERHVYLDVYKPYRDCLIWEFNRLFWRHLADWEAASGKGFEAALPAGSSDANHPDAVAASAREFLTRVQTLEAKGQCPQDLVGLEIGVGTGARAASWLDKFKEFDAAAGGKFYPRMHFLLGDYSPTSLERALAAVAHHGDQVSGVPLDALNPYRSLGPYRFKIMYVHSTNTYDNLPFDDLVRRDGKLYLVEVRAYLNGTAADGLVKDFGFSREELPDVSKRLLEGGPYAVFRDERGVEVWRRLWDAFKLEERLLALDDRDDAHVPPGLRKEHLEDLLAEAPDDVRFHISRGAGESFANTLPLLHPRGYLEVQDIFVSDMDDYRKGFRGPGKLDGSLVTWVNGALLRAVGARAGYDVHFAPFPYRPGTKTTILYTTQRD